MIALWRQWAAKLDQRTLRERALLFVVVAGLVAVLAHAALLQPLLREQRAYFDRINLDQSQLKAINEELVKAAQGAAQDPQAAKLGRIQQLEAALAAAEKRLAQRRDAEQLGPQQVPRLLRDVLGPNRNLQVVGLRVLAPVAVGQAAPVGGQQGNASVAPPAFYRHALEIEMTGTFLDLLKYLDDVEALPWRLSWSGVELKTLVYPQVQLRGTLYTVNASSAFFSF